MFGQIEEKDNSIDGIDTTSEITQLIKPSA